MHSINFILLPRGGLFKKVRVVIRVAGIESGLPNEYIVFKSLSKLI